MVLSKPNILFVDDLPEEVAGVARECESRANVRVAYPQDVSEAFLADADLVLVDYKLEQWAERDNAASIALKPIDGLALSAVLRSQANAQKNNSPTVFAVLSAHVSDLSGSLPPEHREHAIASTTNVEWVFQKSTPGEVLTKQILSLADAVAELPRNWPVDNRERVQKIVESLLLVPSEASWTERILGDVIDCHPPVHELSEWSHGVAFLRWLLHRILPYPCFLWDTYYLAARLRVKHDSLIRGLSEKSEFSTRFEATGYRGILSDFSGPRWWRGAVETIVWEITAGDPFSVKKLQESLSGMSGGVLQASEEGEPVVCVDATFRPLATFYTASSAVRIQPDDWPLYADQPWATIELARSNSRIGAIVLEQDRERL
jgi:hypothetical protein